jgi:hypothetical protein
VATLFSYCIPTDDGAAPNPYWGVCSLAICKPKIRKKARLHDWIVGTGSKNSPIGDISNHVVYTMRVTRRVTMRDYDRIGRTEYLERSRIGKTRTFVAGSETRSTTSPRIPRRFDEACTMSETVSAT